MSSSVMRAEIPLVTVPNERADACGRSSSKLPDMNASIEFPETMDPWARDLVRIAERYCRVIEASGEDTPQWLGEVAHLLPRLQASVTAIGSVDSEHNYPVDLDARFELYTHLRHLLADRDGYFLEFDRAQDGADDMSGSLADDLTDIYCELKHGLRVFEDDPQGTLAAWALSFECHWGQHLADAQRHLATLAAVNRLS